MPRAANIGDLVEVDVGGEDFVFVACGLSDDLTTGIGEVTGAVEFADVPRGFSTDPVNRRDEVTIRSRVRGLFKFPKVL